MPKWTKEQSEAIYKDGQNIIVSAGAGSGKTAVLSERVIEKLKSGIKINELLILTFTNAAAKEMKERIRKKINEHEELKDNLDYLESSYITTFDSFTLSLIKKYNYLLNVDSNISIIDESIISIIKKNILDKVFNEYYEGENSLFKKLLNDFTIKNDTQIKDAIFKIIKPLELKSNLQEFLDNYLDDYLNEDKINEYIKEFNDLLLEEIKDIETNLLFLEDSDYYEYYESLVKALDKLLKSQNYDEIVSNIDINLPRRPRNSEDIKEYKDNIDKIIKNIKSYLRFKDINEIKEVINITKDYIEIIIEIIKKYLKELTIYKNENDLYEFSDIALMAIKLLKENDYIKDELKYYYKEIAIDEYQDTNDLQEEFVNLIENNNVYMVGDIKQSIYGFRNANPQIFKEKYDNYNKLNGGIKIDLLKNFRSRKEVLDGINNIFSLIMDDILGGSSYALSHQMNFGNNIYEENKALQNYNLEIYNYQEDSKFSNEEIESFVIGNDIKNKINNNYQVIDKNSLKLRNVRYDDFCIIMDRGTSFPLVKKIFEYLEIPLMIYEDKKLTNEIDIIILNNIISLILKIKDNIIDQEFKYYFMSVARSFVFSYDDNTIFEIIKNSTYKKTDLYQICLEISKNIDVTNNYELLEVILDKFNYYEKLITYGNVEDALVRIDNLLSIALDLNKMGYTPYMFKDYLKEMINGKNEIKYSSNNVNMNCVKIMNIHKSKGLEFPICYFCGFKKEFNREDIKERFTFDNKYGLIVPYFKEGIGNTILKDLLKNKYNLDNVSERIRLLYVALTRAKEKIIIVAPLKEEKVYVKNLVDFNIRKKYNSFLSILNSINGNLEEYIKNINLDDYNISKNYLYTNELKNNINNNINEVINYKEISILNEEEDNKHASKIMNELITENEYNILEFGVKAHQYFEQADFLLDNKDNPFSKNIINLKEKLKIDENTKIYQEHEFIYEDNLTTYHGIIDLLLIYPDEIKIVDYKLKNIDDPKYVEQLKVYFNYIKSIFNKKIKVYLYSINNNELKEIIM